MQKMNVGVLMGGKSIEREVSFNSGRTVCDHLDTSRYTVIPLFQTQSGLLYILPWRFLHRGKISDFEDRLATDAEHVRYDELKQLVDFVYICVHGQYAEDGSLQGMLEILKIPYLGSKVYASALCMDKVIQKNVLRMHNISVAPDVVITPHQINNYEQYALSIVESMRAQSITFPCIVKPHKEGSSFGVFVVHDEESLEQHVMEASWINGTKQQSVLVEKKLDGFEFSCITIVDYKNNTLLPLPPTEIVPEAGSHIFDYEQKYMPGRAHKFTPARAPEHIIKKIQEVCMQTTRALEMCTISRIDGFVTKNEEVVIVDPNTLSGMAPSSFLFREAAEIGMSHTDLINHLIETELHQYGMLDALIKQEQAMEKIQDQKKMRVAVLFGGRSHEREISLESGRNIVYKLAPHKYEALPLFVDTNLMLYHIPQSVLVRNSTAEIASMLEPSMRVQWQDLPLMADFVFIGLHGGEGEDGTVQGMLEMLSLPYNGSSILASALCIDKFKTNQMLKSKKFDVPDTYLLLHDEWQKDEHACIKTIEACIDYPMIVKPHNDGCSVMVYKIEDRVQLRSAITALYSNGKKHVLVEHFITGMELTVGVIGNDNPRVLPPSYAVSAESVLSIQEKFLPGAGENQTPAPLSQSATTYVQAIIKDVYLALGCKGYARIDCFYQAAHENNTGKERVIIIEVNTLPGMTPATCIFHQAAEIGIKPMDFIDEIITLGLEEHVSSIKKERMQETSW